MTADPGAFPSLRYKSLDDYAADNTFTCACGQVHTTAGQFPESLTCPCGMQYVHEMARGWICSGVDASPDFSDRHPLLVALFLVAALLGVGIVLAVLFDTLLTVFFPGAFPHEH